MAAILLVLGFPNVFEDENEDEENLALSPQLVTCRGQGLMYAVFS
jgi:hypothetical protein